MFCVNFLIWDMEWIWSFLFGWGQRFVANKFAGAAAYKGRWKNFKVICVQGTWLSMSGMSSLCFSYLSVKRLRQNPLDSKLISPHHQILSSTSIPLTRIPNPPNLSKNNSSHRQPTWPCLSLWVALIRTY